MAAVGSADGREIVRELEELRDQGVIGREAAEGRYLDPVSPNGRGSGGRYRVREDWRLITGQGRYTDRHRILTPCTRVLALAVRARADRRDAYRRRRGAPGVLAVLTAADYLPTATADPPSANPADASILAAGVRTRPANRSSRPLQPPLAVDVVRYVGEASRWSSRRRRPPRATRSN